MGEIYQDPDKAKAISQGFTNATGVKSVQTGANNLSSPSTTTAIDRRLAKLQTSND